MQLTVTQRAVARIRPGSSCESVPVLPEAVDTAERRSPRRPMRVVISMLGLLGTVSTGAVSAADTNAAQQLEYWNAQAGAPGQVARGRLFFTSRHGGEWSCASCHGAPPIDPGRHAGTGKPLAPLAPVINPKAFTDSAKVEKWFRRNCKDVAGRECTALEKADLLAYLLQVGR